MSRSSTDEIIEGYIEEVRGYLAPLRSGLAAGADDDALAEVHRMVHTIKGASSMVGIEGLSHIAFEMETAIDEIMAGRLELSEPVREAMTRTVDRFEAYCDGYLASGVPARKMLRETVADFRRIQGRDPAATDPRTDDLINAVAEHEGGPGDAGANLRVCPERADTRVRPYDEAVGRVDAGPETEVPPELLLSFYDEAEEHLQDLGRSLIALESAVDGPTGISTDIRELLRRIRRSVHTLKGAAAVVGLTAVSGFAHRFEDFLDWLYEGAETIQPDAVAVLAESADLLERIVGRGTAAGQGADLAGQADALAVTFREMMETSEVSNKETSEVSQTSEVFPKPRRSSDKKPRRSSSKETSEVSGKETSEISQTSEVFPKPRRYSDKKPRRSSSNETSEVSNELSPQSSVLKSDAGDRGDTAVLLTPPGRTLRVGMERMDELVNLTGEVIIASSAFDGGMEALTGAVNELELARDRLRDIARDMEVGFEVKALDRLGRASLRAAGGGAAAAFEEFDALELDRYSQLNLIIRTLNESVIDVGAIATHLAGAYGDLEGQLNRQRVLLSELQDKMMRVRMTPMAVITNRLRRTVREVAGRLGKQVRLVIEGAEIELDRTVWEKLTDPLMHLLRNAVDHGIEPPVLRSALDKPETGMVRLSAAQEGSQVVIRVTDDGAGLNYPAIRAAVAEAGLSDRPESLTEPELADFIFYPGFSTRGKVSEISGRGVGMDVVRENIESLRGDIRVNTWKSAGSRFTIRIPLTLAAVRALLFSVRDRTYAVALNEIQEIMRLDPESRPRGDREGEVVRIEGEILPLFDMAEVLRTPQEAEAPPPVRVRPLVLVVAVGERRAALAIDALVGQREIVVKSTGTHLRQIRGISGVTIMGDGSVVPILSLEPLLWADSAPDENPTPGVEPPSGRRPFEILVVDDSVSIRQVISRLLSDQGWRVETARDGIEALERLRERTPDLILLDIEMPRMNGYELLNAINAQPDYRKIPVVMLTSRTAEKHRDRAVELGARGYVTKPYNDDDLVELVLQLLAGR